MLLEWSHSKGSQLPVRAKKKKNQVVLACGKVASDVKASIPAELEEWRKFKSPQEQNKLLVQYFYDALKSMSMAEKEGIAAMLLAMNCIASKR